ncbi:MAG: 16S rRNA (cytidine(1402)-2'-O)-methyltransferase [Gemmatimonadaceae bacterium]|nr:16S rRNA (cytidine(1402)-2'-O)-methyltransferase [Gemmatimonadaceae bacterium]
MTEPGHPGGAAGAGQLYVVSTPIGNMGDFSFRAVETLRAVARVLAEDTRHSRHLLDRYEIATPLQAYHEHNEAKATPGLVARLLAGESFALISDAGTPLLSDPGARLVRAAADAGVTVTPVPGASALLAALVGAGLDATRFTFYGFPPRKGREREALLREVATLAHTAVLYEAPGRVAATLAELAAHGAGEREAVVARELTKQFENIRRGTVSDLSRYYTEAAPRGEVVLLVGGAPPAEGADEATVRARARALRSGGASARDTATALVDEFQLARNAAYRVAQEEAPE